jgi:hypothetical protein
MNRKQFTLTSLTLGGLAALVFAHHIPVGLSHVAGTEILSEVVFFTNSGTFGVPAYRVGSVEAPEHHDPVGLADGDSFHVMNQAGLSETISFEAADFADIGTAAVEDIVGVINAKSNLVEALDVNGYVALRGMDGGGAASLSITDGTGAPLSLMGVGSGVALGSDNLELTLSIPDPSLNLAGRTYVVLASATDGSFQLNNHSVPIGHDNLTTRLFQATVAGNLPGFLGTLGANSDATAQLLGSQIQAGFAGNYPDKLYFAFLVLNGNRVAFVSNRFVVDFQ